MDANIVKIAAEALSDLPIEEQVGAAEYIKHVLKAEQENESDERPKT